MKNVLFLFFLCFYSLSIYSLDLEKVFWKSSSKSIDLLNKSYILYDPKKEYTIEKIYRFWREKKEFRKLHSYQIGFYEGKIWISFSIENMSEEKEELYLLIAPWHIDTITVYEYTDNEKK